MDFFLLLVKVRSLTTTVNRAELVSVLQQYMIRAELRSFLETVESILMDWDGRMK